MTSSLSAVPLSSLGRVAKVSPASNLLNRPEPDIPPVGKSNADNAPENLYATIVKGGKEIAKIYKSGVMESPNGVGLPELTNNGAPLDIAKARAQEIAEYSGGTVEYARNSGANVSPAYAKTLFDAQLLANRQ